MIELPEVFTLTRQLSEEVVGKRVEKVHPPSSEHKFCWFSGDVTQYDKMLQGHEIVSVEGFGFYVEITFDHEIKLNIRDGVNVRLLTPKENRPEKYQLLIDFADSYSLLFTVAMYGGIQCGQGISDNVYYAKSRESISPLGEEFDEVYFKELMSSVKSTMSAKAFLATEQRIPGIGNGVLQDILLQAGIHPKRKIAGLSDAEKEKLFRAVKDILSKMASQGGRDTEKDLYGNAGGYQTMLSKKTVNKGCSFCGGAIERKAYMGGSVYYCLQCQPYSDNR